MLEKLYAELGKLMVQAEILGTLVIPTQGRIGGIKGRIAKELNNGGMSRTPQVDRKPGKDTNRDKVSKA